MVGHNASHAQELQKLAEQVNALGETAAYEQILQAVGDFEKGNLRLSAVLASMDDAAVDAKLAEMKTVDYERIGEREYVEMVLVHGKDNGERLAALCKKVADTGRGVIIDCENAETAKQAVEAVKDTKPILNGANGENYEAMDEFVAACFLPHTNRELFPSSVQE